MQAGYRLRIIENNNEKIEVRKNYIVSSFSWTIIFIYYCKSDIKYCDNQINELILFDNKVTYYKKPIEMKILFAEDDNLLRNSLTFYLKNQGFVVTSVGNGLEVKELLKTELYNIIITDLNMPFIGGMEVINFVRNDLKQDTPIIVLTSFGIEKAELDAFEIGASEFVSKPFSPSILKARIDKLLAKQKK